LAWIYSVKKEKVKIILKDACPRTVKIKVLPVSATHSSKPRTWVMTKKKRRKNRRALT
jgi:hypothetical protein